MKTILLLSLVFALSQALFVPHYAKEHPHTYESVLGINGTMYNLESYFDGLFNYFGLQQTEVIECFNLLTSELYFQEMTAYYDYANATSQGNSALAQEYFALEQSINATLFNTINCVYNTQDWSNLLIAAHFNTFNRTLQGYLNYLYYQAHLTDFFIGLTPVITLLKQGDFYQAGKVYGSLFQDIAANSTHQNEFNLAYQAFQNGMFAYYNLSQPTQLASCFNYTTAQNAFDYLFYWARTVHASNLTNLTSNTQFYFQYIGKQLAILNIPVYQCENSTADFQRLNNAVGHQIHGAIFENAIENYIYNQQVNYFVIFEEIWLALANVNVFGAGKIYADFLNDVSIYIGPQSSEY